MPFLKQAKENTLPITIVKEDNFKNWLSQQDDRTKNQINAHNFKGKAQKSILIIDADGKTSDVIACVPNDNDMYKYAHLPTSLPYNEDGYFVKTRLTNEEEHNLAVSWTLGAMEQVTYKTEDKPVTPSQLLPPENIDEKYVATITNGIKLVRDLINIPTNDMGPNELEQAARELAEKFNCASFNVIKDQNVLEKDFPLIHAVGRASADEPRLIDFSWGKEGAPTVTLVGKGVCYDTGGLNIKPGGSMAIMKKDMGGAAHVLGLAQMIMDANLPIRLRVLIPAVENSISSNAYRPGDVLTSRKGLTVEIDNTDAEGRLVLADALTLACEDKPDLLIDFATLTGAARVALGPELPPIMSNNDDIARDLINSGQKMHDPLWQLPLWDNYLTFLKSDIADIKNSGGGMAGAITAGLFLQKFVTKDTNWVHFDTYGWNPSEKAGRPKGGADYGMRASFDTIKKRFAPPKPQ